ncbi:MAG: large conductance mechanosensitive channel protein MscL [Flavobacteriaceae bacterium]|nr:large conductance mechanosensitive channel protein MscL [Flavobacteriaceae bacterium]MDG1063473.1 large conductance mechanosensitive channel protein MscL [Flavobacteriaceae bacterium]MDG1962130.1 large conductance mechanosensitive channel protein MscL [Flavobacteriaceae bacterium]
MLKEFKNFIMTGNVIELSVAVILAGAVGAVISGFTNNIMMPIVGHFSGGMDFSSFKIILSPAVLDANGAIVTAENAILYGHWINAVINLIIVGFILFLIIRSYRAMERKKEAAPAAPAPAPGPTEIDLLKEIRDALKK